MKFGKFLTMIAVWGGMLFLMYGIGSLLDSRGEKYEAKKERRRPMFIGYPDDEYCATVIYSNPRTSKTSKYYLPVTVENNKLTVIHWPNGGWLDESHFDPPNIVEGYVTIESDQNVTYEVIIEDGRTDCFY